MYKLFVILVLVLFSCKSRDSAPKKTNFIEGKWIVLYPDHDSMSKLAREVYGEVQDSIVRLKGLKLLRFETDGRFFQADSFGKPGTWKIWNDAEKRLTIKDGGGGFSPFTAILSRDEDSLVVLTESVNYKDRSLRLDWHIKRLSEEDASFFFNAENNKWRIKPTAAESPKALKEKLYSMLVYYARYYTVVSTESTYFIPSRIQMPFKFYQHAVGLEPLSQAPGFQHFFHSEDQANEAHGYLDQAIERLDGYFPPKEDSYVKEYAEYLKLIAGKMKKMAAE